MIRQPPTLPYRLQYSTIGRISLNHRVRDENGCVPYAHRHQKCLCLFTPSCSKLPSPSVILRITSCSAVRPMALFLGSHLPVQTHQMFSSQNCRMTPWHLDNNTTLTFSILRKEVIQPHLPIRLPCYDFTPVIRPAFDCSLLKGWVTGFGHFRLPWCDGRCVQDPGTYSPRHADPRLLAIPASCSRVADYNPN